MNAILWVFLAAAGVPNVTAGPDLAEAAVEVNAPISEVTVYSDRAKIIRSARQALKAGPQAVRLPDLPGSVLMDTVRVGCSGAKVLRVEAMPIERERWTIEQIEGLIDKLEALTDKLALADMRRQVYQLELNLLAGIAPRAPVPEQERVGKADPPIEPDMWRRVLDFLQKRRDAVRATVRKLDEERRVLGEELTKVQREVSRHDLGAFTDRKIQVLAIVQAAQAGQATLSLEYFVPGASWKPTYDLTYEANTGRVRLRTAGLVQQATGEDWGEVGLRLSTSIPGRGVDLPELLTWALGEKKEFIPRAVAARMPAAAPRFAPPRASKTPYEARREAKLQVLRQRISKLQNLLALDGRSLAGHAAIGVGGLGSIGAGRGGGGAGYGRAAGNTKSFDFDSATVTGELARPQAAQVRRERRKMRRPSRRPPPAPPSAGPRPVQPAPAMEESVVMADKSVSRSSRRGGRAYKAKATERVATTSLGLFDQGYYRAPRFSDPMLPAVVAGGLDYVWACPSKMTIPSTGEQIEVPLDLQSYPAQVLYEATPSLKETAYLKAEVTNKSQRPILGGTVNIFMGPDFAGQGQLKTTGPGGKLPLPLGADEDIRLKRKVVPKTETEGVFSKDEVTTYKVTIEVGNYKKRAATIAIWDQVPKSGNEEIEIELGKKSPVPVKGPDVDGVMRWELTIPAGQTKKIEFSYKIERPENWQLHQ